MAVKTFRRSNPNQIHRRRGKKRAVASTFLRQRKKKHKKQRFVAVGDSKDIKVKVKDRIIHDKYAGTSIKIGSEEHMILKADDVLAIVE